jgi:hypothetical protein
LERRILREFAVGLAGLMQSRIAKGTMPGQVLSFDYRSPAETGVLKKSVKLPPDAAI